MKKHFDLTPISRALILAGKYPQGLTEKAPQQAKTIWDYFDIING
jgi:hypothetical protein